MPGAVCSPVTVTAQESPLSRFDTVAAGFCAAPLYANSVPVHDNAASFGAIVNGTRPEVALLVTPASDTTQ